MLFLYPLPSEAPIAEVISIQIYVVYRIWSRVAVNVFSYIGELNGGQTEMFLVISEDKACFANSKDLSSQRGLNFPTLPALYIWFSFYMFNHFNAHRQVQVIVTK